MTRNNQTKATRLELKQNKALAVKTDFFALFDPNTDYFPLLETSNLVNKMLQRYLDAPSNATKRNMKALADELQPLFEPLPALLTFAFLEGDEHPFIVALREIFSTIDVADFNANLSMDVLCLIGENHFVAALMVPPRHADGLSSTAADVDLDLLVTSHAMMVAPICKALFREIIESCRLWEGDITLENPAIKDFVYLIKLTYDMTIEKCLSLVALVEEYLSLDWLEDKLRAAKLREEPGVMNARKELRLPMALL